MFRVLDRLVDGLGAVAKYVMLAMTACIFAIILFTVVTRYVFGFVVSWSEEVPRYLLVWISLLGTALAVDRKEHIGFDAIFKRLPPRGQRVLDTVLNAGMAFVALVMLYYGIDFVRQFGGDLMESIPITNFWLYIALPVSGSMILLYVIRRELQRFLEAEQGRDPVRRDT
jgi:TRAP-type C4-dicarboxylate transport system permease small subunit